MKKRLYFLPTAIIVFILLVVGTFLDLEISQNIAHIGNTFTKIFAMLSCFPVAVATGIISTFFIQLTINRYQLIWQKVILIICGVIAFLGSTYLFGSHLASYHAFNLNKVYYLLGLCVSLPSAGLGYYLYRYADNKHLIRNIVFLLIAVGLTAGMIEIIKILTPRVRYTTVSQMPGGLDLYRPWYLTNLNDAQVSAVEEWGKNLGMNEEHKSFPSGHSNISLAASFILVYLPFFFKNKRLFKFQGLLFYIGFIYFLICAFSRIFGGAHYLSDTMFAGALALMVYFIANEIYLRKINKEKTA